MCPRDVPEPPSIANSRHQHQLMNVTPARALNLRPTHENTLVMRSSRPARRGSPRMAPRVTGRLRSPWYPAAAPASTTARPSTSRRVRQSPGECRSRRGRTPRIVRAGPSSLTVLRIPLRGTRLRRAVDPGDLCQPSGPDGEGQAEARPGRRAANLCVAAKAQQPGRRRPIPDQRG